MDQTFFFDKLRLYFVTYNVDFSLGRDKGLMMLIRCALNSFTQVILPPTPSAGTTGMCHDA